MTQRGVVCDHVRANEKETVSDANPCTQQRVPRYFRTCLAFNLHFFVSYIQCL